MTTTFTVDWALAGQVLVCAIVFVVLLGAIAMGSQRRED